MVKQLKYGVNLLMTEIYIYFIDHIFCTLSNVGSGDPKNNPHNNKGLKPRRIRYKLNLVLIFFQYLKTSNKT